jgi:membrane protease YdiL (CAAX protease family)
VPPDTEHRPTSHQNHALGISLPRSGWWRWLRDPHFVVAVLAAVPVWVALGFVAGDRMRPNDTLTALISLLVVQPIVEELVFRGVLQGHLLGRGWIRRIGPVSSANVTATVAFAALHLLAQPPAWAIAVAVPSLVFGHLRERFASVLPSIVLHAIYNAGFAFTAWCVQR